ncbi:hypothetical protein HY948_04885 [Candidatus Gottesmanbacteria bacterium]|nr:hypothetical protein [Candidatus Gottesmanbacteria bacterium]
MKSFKHYLLILAISVLPVATVFFTPDLPHTHDGPVHLARMAAYYKALTAGQIFPRWASDLNYGYGMPLFNFIYQLPYLIASVFLFLNTSLVLSFKYTLALSYLLSGIFMFAFAKAFWKDDKKALLVALFYQFAPFRLVELFVRGSFGEIYTYALLPLVLLGLTQIRAYFILTSVASALLIISHNSMSLIFFGVCVLFVFFFAKTAKLRALSFIALICGLLLSAWYWLPAIMEHRYTYGDLFMKDMYRDHFAPIWQFILPNFINSPLLQTGGVSVQWGIFHIGAVFLSLVFIVRNKLSASEKTVAIFSLILTTGSLFFMLYPSIYFWKTIPILRQFQFPWRLVGLAGFTTSLLSVYYLSLPIFHKTKAFTLLLTLVVLSTSYYWLPPLGFDQVRDESQYWNYPLNTTYFGETDVIWSAGPAKAYPKERVEVAEGKAVISAFTQKSIVQTLQVNATTNATLVSHTQYFPGWRVFVDNNKVPIQFQNANWRGLITFPVPTGQHTIHIKLGKTKVQFISEILSLSTLILMTGVVLWRRVGRTT